MSPKLVNKPQKLEKMIRYSPIQYAIEHYEDNIAKILTTDALDKETAKIINGCAFCADRRNPVDYAQETILGWVLQSFIRNKLNCIQGVTAYDNGCDKQRRFLPKNELTSDADLLIHVDNAVLYDRYLVEIISDYNGFWARYGVCHLRGNKLDKLIDSTKEDAVLLCLVDIENELIGFVPVGKDMTRRYIPSHWCYGNKPAWEIDIDINSFTSFDELSHLKVG